MTQDLSTNEMDAIDFSKIPVRALNYSSRMNLSQFLMHIMPLTSSKGFSRDFRGLLELMEFTYQEAENFSRHSEPLKEALNIWGTRDNSSIGALIEMLKQMERLDVIADLMPSFERDAKTFLKSKQESANQLALFSAPQALTNPNNHQLTFNDLQNNLANGGPGYHAYLFYCDKDVDFVRCLVQELEKMKLKFYLRDRDEDAGGVTYDMMVKIITQRCLKVVMILSPDFFESPLYAKQMKYVTSLAQETRDRMLIPVIYKPCQIPAEVRILSKIDFTRPEVKIWQLPRLLKSLNPYFSLPNTNCPQISNETGFLSSLSIHTLPPSNPSLVPIFDTQPSTSPILPQISNQTDSSSSLSIQTLPPNNNSTSVSPNVIQQSTSPKKKSSKFIKWVRSKITETFRKRSINNCG